MHCREHQDRPTKLATTASQVGGVDEGGCARCILVYLRYKSLGIINSTDKGGIESILKRKVA
jgi:hypothetical protein